MAEFPYLLVLESTLAGNGTGTVSYTLPQGEELELTQMRFQSTGTFNITDIRDSSGNHMTNASPAVEIPSAVMQPGNQAFRSLGDFTTPFLINQGKTFYVDLEDSSGSSNTVTLVFAGKRKTT